MSQWKGHAKDNLLANVGPTETGPSQNPTSGALTYEPYYGLKAKPFSLSTDPRTLFKSPSHTQVVQDVVSAIRRREGLIVLAGEMGTGKTTLCRAALYQLERKTFTAFVPDPFLSREDLLRMLLVGFGEVSVDELKRGRLKGAPRADLRCQLFEFLTSLESVDAFAILVMDEAHHLEPPLLDEIRALSELEAGRRLLQIVLVGQPGLRTRLKLPEMRSIAQRVTTVCELQPLSREAVGGYVSHRIAVAGGARERVEFSPTALDMVHQASGGIPRLVNRICDRALAYGHIDRTSQIGQAQVARAVGDLDMTSPSVGRPEPGTTARLDFPMSAQAGPSTPPATPGGLFGKRTTVAAAAQIATDLNALLELTPVARHAAPPSAPSKAERPTRTTNQASSRERAWLRGLKSLALPLLGITVMLLAGGLAVRSAGAGSVQVELPPVPAPPTPAPTARLSEPQDAQQTWVVQVAALSKPDRASDLVQELADSGLPAHQVDTDLGSRGHLMMVRVGPYASAEEADAVLDRLQSTADYEGAFVRNITTGQ